MEPIHMLQLQAKMGMGLMAMNKYSTLPRAELVVPMQIILGSYMETHIYTYIPMVNS